MERYVAGYVRVSTEHQVERDSLVNQQEAIKAFAAAKGLPLRMFVDAGYSAKDTERPALRELLVELEKGAPLVVAITKLDRLTRSLRDLVGLYDVFEEREVSLVSLTQSLDTSTPIGRFVFYVLGLVAQMEREMTAERETENMAARARRGKWNGGPAPFGFTCKTLEERRFIEREVTRSGRKLSDLLHDPEVLNQAEAHALSVVKVPKGLVADEAEAEIVRMAFESLLRIKSVRGVTHYLNSLGKRTRHGKTWAMTSVKRMLKNPFYKGTLAYNRRKGHKHTSRQRPESEHIMVEGVIPAIVPEAVWDKVQFVLRSQAHVASSTKRSRLLLSGLPTCGHCGGKLFAGVVRRTGKTYRYYRCNTHIAKGKSVCPGASVRVEHLDETIVGALRSIGTRPDAVRAQLQEAIGRYKNETVPLMKREGELQGALKLNRQKVGRLVELFENGDIDRDLFRERKAELERDERQMHDELGALRARLSSGDVIPFDVEQAVGMLANVGAVFDGLEFEDKRELLRTVFKKIVVGDSGISYQIRVLPELFTYSDSMDTGSWPRRA